MDEKIEVKNVRPFTISNNPRLQGFCDIEIGEILIRDFRILRDEDGKVILAFPQNERFGSHGEKSYGSLISTSFDLKMKIQEVVIGAWKNLLKDSKGE